jgi:hypothetical protein
MSLRYNRTYTLVAWSLDVLWSKICITVTSFVPICIKIRLHDVVAHSNERCSNSYEYGREFRSNTNEKIGEDTLKIDGRISSLFILDICIYYIGIDGGLAS